MPFVEPVFETAVTFCGLVAGMACWGFYACLFVVTLWTLRTKRIKALPVVLGIIFINLVNLVDLVTDNIKSYRWFWNIAICGDPLGAYRNANWAVIKDICFLLSVAVYNCVIFWRAYSHWARDRRLLILPASVLVILSIGGGFIIKYDVLIYYHPDNPHFASSFHPWALGLLVTQLTFCWITTLMIIAKLLRVRKYSDATSRPNAVLFSALTFNESGAFFSLAMAIYVGFWGAGKKRICNAMDYVLLRIIGIVSVLLVLQLSLGYTQSISIPQRAGDTAAAGQRTGDPEAVVIQVTRPIPTARKPVPAQQRDSLSFRFSSSDDGDRVQLGDDGEEKAKEDIVRRIDWVTLESSGRWATVGGTDVARQLHLDEDDPGDSGGQHDLSRSMPN